MKLIEITDGALAVPRALMGRPGAARVRVRARVRGPGRTVVLPGPTVRRLVDREVAEGLGDSRGGVLTSSEQLLRQRRIVAAVEAMSRRLLGDKPCLTQALVAQRLLREDGFDSVLRIGVAKDGERSS